LTRHLRSTTRDEQPSAASLELGDADIPGTYGLSDVHRVYERLSLVSTGSVNLITVLSICALLLLGQTSPQDAALAIGSSTESPPLPELIATYLQTPDATERRRLADRISSRSDGDIPAVIAVLQSAPLWSPTDSPEGSHPLALPSGGVIEVRYRVPPDYDAATALPLILVVSEGDAAQTIEHLTMRLGESANRYILVCPQRWPGETFHHPAQEATEFREMVVAIRRAFHTDTDRWYLHGSGPAGDAAWLAAILHRDIFAGLFVCGSYPKMPHAEHLYPLLLPNLADTRVLSVWQRPKSGETSGRDAVVAAHNHAVLDLALLRFVGLTGVEKSTADEDPPWPSPERLNELLSARRSPMADRMSHWFRYAGQGRVGPLLQAQYRGDEWTSSQLSILPGPSVDRDTYVSDILKDHLAFLACRRDGAIYRLETRNCAGVNLLIPFAHLNSERQITVYCNDAVRYDKPVAPSMRTLLENAYVTWDFKRPVAAEISISIRRDQP